MEDAGAREPAVRVERTCPVCGARISIEGDEADVCELVIAWWGRHGGEGVTGAVPGLNAGAEGQSQLPSRAGTAEAGGAQVPALQAADGGRQDCLPH